MESAPYELGENAQATNDLKRLRELALERGLRHEFLSALTTIVHKLQQDPIAWGDPEYHLKKEGGCIFHAACNPLFVRYAVFELEKKVMLLRVAALSMSELE